jgi:beta-N-acetylhexosaminidase
MAAGMELREQVGQTLIMGFEGTELTGDLRTMLRELRPAGVILFARNIVEPRQTWGLLRALSRTAEHPLFLCVDLEGGTVDRLRSVLAPAPSAAAVAAARRPDLARLHGLLIGRACRALGFNTDFAPVLDLARPGAQRVMGSRVPARDAENVIAYGRQFLRGLKAADVLGCGKHFPGQGHGDLDSHYALPVVEKTLRELRDDLAPYRALRAALPMVMVAHLAYPAVTGDRTPASMSAKWITGILRRRLGYRGLVVSDDMEMGAALSAGSIEEVAARSLAAGADLMLICRRRELVARGFEAALRRAESDARFRARIRESAARVLAFKRRARPLHSFPAAPARRVVGILKQNMNEFSELVEQAGRTAVAL